MNNIYIQKYLNINKIKNWLIIFIIILFNSTPINIASAASANPVATWTWNDSMPCNVNSPIPAITTAVRFDIHYSGFSFSSGTGILRPSNTTTFTSPTFTGKTYIEGGAQSDFNLDNSLKSYTRISDVIGCLTETSSIYTLRFGVKGSTSGSYSISSSNNSAVKCLNDKCTAQTIKNSANVLSSQQAKITASSSDYSYSLIRNFRWYLPNGNEYWFPWSNYSDYTHNGSFNLGSQSIDITVNTPPKVTYKYADNIDYNTATLHWEYSDPEDNKQEYYKIQVATQENFGNLPSPPANKSSIAWQQNLLKGNVTSQDVGGLRPGIKYYVRVAVKDLLEWSSPEWSNVGQFTTKKNDPPNLAKLSCQLDTLSDDNNKYKSAKVKWIYNGQDEPEDELIVKARFKIHTDEKTPKEPPSLYNNAKKWIIVDLGSNPSGETNIGDLISGYKYEVEIYLNDSRNDASKIANPLPDETFWKKCGTVIPPNYPAPNVDFSLTGGDGNLVKINKTDATKLSTGLIANNKEVLEVLKVKTGDKVFASWNITNPEQSTNPSLTDTGVIDKSCSINTTNKSQIINIFNKSNNELKVDSLSQNKDLPVSTSDITYSVKLTCLGKPAKTIQNLDATISLTVLSYPTVSCSIQSGKKSVKVGDSSVNVIANVGNVNNVSNYNWKIGKDYSNLNSFETGSGSGNSLTKTLDYAGLGFGKYNPWVSVTKLANTDPRSRTAEAICGSITNFGSSTIKEVNP